MPEKEHLFDIGDDVILHGKVVAHTPHSFGYVVRIDHGDGTHRLYATTESPLSAAPTDH